MITPEEAIARLDAIDPDSNRGDPEGSHVDADLILLEAVSEAVSKAYDRVIERAGDWWYA